MNAKKKKKIKFLNFNRADLETREKPLHGIDPLYLTIVIVLSIMGLLVLFSSSYAKAIGDGHDSLYYLRRQIISELIGIGFMIFFIFLPDVLLKIGGNIVALVCIPLLIAVYFVPTRTEHRWFYFGSFQFQPSEFAKLALIVVLAFFLSYGEKNMEQNNLERKKLPKLLRYYPYLLAIAFIVLVLFETHLSGAGLMFMITISIIIASRRINWKVALPVILIAIAVFMIVLFTNEYMMNRVRGLIGLEQTSGDNYQIQQSLYAIGSGGFTGLGLGKSRQKYLYLPEPQNDFIFPIACEELGFIGASLIVILFILLIARGFSFVLKSKNKFHSLMALGITVNLGVQIALNLLVVTGIFPVTGISLPFFSYGGTAIMCQFAEVGMMLHLSRYCDLSVLSMFRRKKPKKKQEAVETAPEINGDVIEVEAADVK